MSMLVDPLNTLDVSAVPIVLLVDRNGVIRYRRPTLSQVREFLNQPEVERPVSTEVPGQQWAEGDRAAMSGRVDEARMYYERALSSNPQDARLNFRLGVVHRLRYDSAEGDPADFDAAIRFWKRALALNPNQYIWRRRIQQYGPILDKPYPFYDWVSQARQEIQARGETPIELSVEPRGAELAGPRTRIDVRGDTPVSPDPQGQVKRDVESSVISNAIVVPSTDRKQRAVRVHLSLQPDTARGYAWNNEVEPVTVWIEGDDLEISNPLQLLPGPATATSQERREADFEVRWSEPADGPAVLHGYALYHACEKETGVCIYRRKDLTIHLNK